MAVEEDAQATTVVYDLMGRHRGNSLSGLPAGMYIVNGRTVIKR